MSTTPTDIYVTDLDTGERFRFPALPAKISFGGDIATTTVDVDNLGSVPWPSGRGPRTIGWSGTFWGEDRQFAPGLHREYRDAGECVDIIQAWVDRQPGSLTEGAKRLRLQVLGTWLDLVVFVWAWSGDLTGYAGDVPYQIEFTEARTALVRLDGGLAGQAANGDPLGVAPTDLESYAQDDPPVPATVTVQPGDTLWTITQLALGDGGRWQEVYDLNLEVIGPDPDGLQPGMVLVIPRPGTNQVGQDQAVVAPTVSVSDVPAGVFGGPAE